MDEFSQLFLADNETFVHLLVALALGALIGLERGFTTREAAAGERVAGIRTFALVGLLGGIAGLLSTELTIWAFPFILFSLSLLGLTAYKARADLAMNFSITGTVSLLIAFCLGAIAVAVDLAVATAAAVITALILDNKREIHGLINKLHEHELDAALKLLVISVVMLPMLPNQGMGPGDAINPYQLWWMVVLIASISFVGYFAIRVGGTEKGILFTSLFAGLSSSTALSLHFSRQSKKAPEMSPMLAVGILIACGTMFPRILGVSLILNAEVVPYLLVPVLIMATMLYLPALWLWRKHRQHLDVEQPKLTQNPLDLKSALFFGAVLITIMFLGEYLREWLGDAGIYLLAASSGVADVDAITLSLLRMAQENIAVETAVVGIIIASGVNNIVKASIAGIFGTRQLGIMVAIPMLLSVLVGLSVAYLLY